MFWLLLLGVPWIAFWVCAAWRYILDQKVKYEYIIYTLTEKDDTT